MADENFSSIDYVEVRRIVDCAKAQKRSAPIAEKILADLEARNSYFVWRQKSEKFWLKDLPESIEIAKKLVEKQICSSVMVEKKTIRAKAKSLIREINKRHV